jgi:hypothetical protein
MHRTILIAFIMPEETKTTTFGNIVNLIKALAWPTLILYILLYYRQPISETLSLFPNLVRHASKFSAGGVTLEIEQVAQQSGNEQLAVALKGLSPPARKLLLQVGSSYWAEWSKGAPGGPADYFSPDRPELDELVKRKLFTFKEDQRTFELWVQTLGKITTSEDSNQRKRELRVSRPLTTEQQLRLTSQEFFLSPLGRKAYDVILDVVVNST